MKRLIYGIFTVLLLGILLTGCSVEVHEDQDKNNTAEYYLYDINGSIVDHYIEENGGEVFTVDATPEDATAPAAVVAEATATDAVLISLISRISHCFGSSKEWFRASA